MKWLFRIVLVSIGLLFVGACGDDHETRLPQDAGVQVAGTALPDAGNASGDSGSIQVEVRLGAIESTDTGYTLLEIGPPDHGESRVGLVTNGGVLRALYADDSGLEGGVGVTLDSLRPVESHTLTFTWGRNMATWYIDGRMVGESTYSGTLRLPPGTPLTIHAPPQGSPDGTIRVEGLKVYGRPLSPGEIV